MIGSILFWQLIAPTEPSVYVRSFAAGHVEIVHANSRPFLPSCEASAGGTAKGSDTSRASGDASAEFVQKA
jgi:hypothetical protein